MSFFNKYSAKLAGTLQETNSPGFTGTDADGNAIGNRTATSTLGTFTPLPDPFGRGRTSFSLSGEIPSQVTFNQSTGVITLASSFGAINSGNRVYNLTVTASEISPNSGKIRAVARTSRFVVIVLNESVSKICGGICGVYSSIAVVP